MSAEYVAELRGIAYDLRRWAPPSPHCNVAANSLERIAWEMEQSAEHNGGSGDGWDFVGEPQP